MSNITPTSMETVSGIFFDVVNPKVEDVKLTDIAWSLSRQPRFAGHTITKLPYNVAHHSVFVTEIIKHLVEWLDNSTTIENTEEYILSRAKNNSISPPPFLDAHDDFNWGVLTRLHTNWEDFCNELSDNMSNHEKPDIRFLDPNRAILMLALLHDAHEYVLVDIPSPIKQIDNIKQAYKHLETQIDTVILKSLFNVELNDTVKKLAHDLIKAADLIARRLEAYMYMPSRGNNWGGLPTVDILAIHNFNEPMTAVDSYTAFMECFEKI